MGDVILDKSVDFAVRCVKFYNYLRDEKREYVMSKQMLWSGTSIGANISESQGSQSNPDFIAKFAYFAPRSPRNILLAFGSL